MNDLSPTCHRLGVLRGFLLLLGVTALLLAPAASAQDPDPFYERLYGEALRSSHLDRHREAAKELRIACFGMLEHPQRLGDCLARLALEEAELGRSEDFVATASRLMEVEERYRGYSTSDLPEPLRRRFESLLEELAPLEMYQRVPAFKEVAERRQAARILALPVERRNEEVDSAISRDPNNPRWRLLKGNLALDQGRSAEAAEIAESLATDHSDDDGVLCLRGRARAATGTCSPEDLQDLDRCSGTVRGRALEAALRCHVRTESWEQASETLGAMDAEQREQRAIRALAREIRKGRRDRGGEAPEVAASPKSGEASPGQEEGQSLAAGWDVLRSDARDRFEPTYEEIRQLADRRPTWGEAQHLAAELAYRLSLWDEAVLYFRRAEEIVSAKPNLQFYLAVALYKSGDFEGASRTLDQCLPHIQSSDFVDFWVERIRSGEG